MHSPIWDQSSLFLLRDLAAAQQLPDYTFHAATGHSATKFSQNCFGSALGRHRGSGPALADAVGRGISAEQSTFFADVQGLAALICVVLPAFVPSRGQSQAMKLWIVGCQTGQDVCSVAITLAELCPQLADGQVVIVASDPDPGMLARAERGIYTRTEVERGLPTEWLVRYFKQLPGSLGWRFSSPLSDPTNWLRLDPYESCAAVGVADVVMCPRTFEARHLSCSRRLLFRRLTDQLAPDGFLILPDSTSNSGREPGFECLCAGGSVIYRRSRSRASVLSA